MSEITAASLMASVDECMLGDRHTFARQCHQLQKQVSANVDVGVKLLALAQRMNASALRLKARQENVPEIHYPDELPVSQRVDDIRKAIAAHQVVILAGETGSGKTTQIPKICLQMGRGVAGLIAHTQPRRLAARAVAERLSEELNTTLGDGVAYQIRFQEVASPNSYIKLMTDGILLAAIQRDRFLKQYDTIIIDEAHERSLNIDFLLGYLKTLLPKRPELKLIITSATIDVERFSTHFNNAPVIEVSGRSYPVEYRYRPQEELSADNDIAEAVELVLKELMAEGAHRHGDTLVFLSGERDIREVAHHLKRAELPGAEILPLYSRLSSAEQQRIFDLRGRRGWRVVLATNVAETSLTVPGIRYVIDGGTARVSRYSVRSKVQRLPIEAISQASANQRAGRCGRVAPGIAYRLYSEADYLARPEYTEPEIQRTNLAAVILQMLQLKLGDISGFPFVDAPDKKFVNDGFALLSELGAVVQGRITPLGDQLGRFPVDPRIGRLILAAAEKSCLREMLIIASALSIQDPRERPADKRQASDEKHRRFWHEDSDFAAFVSLWDYAEEKRQELSASQWRKLCQREFLSWTRMREWREVHHQLTLMCRQLNLKLNKDPADFNNIHRALLPGFLGQIAAKDEGREFIGARNRKLHIFPGSSLFKKPPKWIVAAELAETTQLYARCVAKIDPEWVLGVNDSLLKRQYYEPHWQARSGRVMAFEQTALYGLVIRDKKRVHYGPIAPEESREILIRQALVEGRYQGRAAFYRHNKKLILEITELEDKSRRRDILISDEELFRYYDERIPAGITTAKHLEHWLKTIAPANTLFLSRGELMRHGGGDVTEQQFPDSLICAGMELALNYHFEPGHPADGVSVSVPLTNLAHLPDGRLDWLVPGLLREKCIALVKILPKAQRKQLVPVPDYVDRALPMIKANEQALLPQLAEALRKLSGLKIEVNEWASNRIDDYYLMNIKVLDNAGKLLVQGRNLQKLKAQLAGQIQQGIAEQSQTSFTSRVIQEWDFGRLEKEHEFKRGGATLTAYPCLRDNGENVVLELAESRYEAEQANLYGVLRLLLLKMSQQVKMLKGSLFRSNAVQLQFAAVGEQKKTWLEGCLLAAARHSFDVDPAKLPEVESDFERLWQDGRANFTSNAERYAALLTEILGHYSEIRRALKKLNALSWIHSINDINQQIKALFAEGFITELSLDELEQYPRYLRAVLQRITKLDGHYQRDRQCTLILEPLQQQLSEFIEKSSDRSRAYSVVREYRWQLEEFRISLFAQNIGTRAPVSEKRLKQLWKSVSQDVTF
ncbi:ATP-dependent RNA helicase SrmB [Zhongshania aliphaticivorans]|uniref:ATP-dependent RNA helicase SrmB n=1 Tax=Zhongshania aliphaticivorans TaxID=1470434 RepID=A0A5S9NHD7_9GAMM|nr:ATP-dependent RNA helicase HrpA [Zhongshania aliphaticivorans]CAA0088105.1 ATP-dependent RNA helicase SrmB [Zhongshania aliphaticivorans]CAA0115965.1 ATP-dependent RNA helicase SrmB [Zhongshania aliphaticivorans]CAA0120353.1 ATP-dependent RNA helicase SrmB [Zhongshania aliphaticivorans]